MKLTSRLVWGIAIGLLSVIGTGSLAFGDAIHGRWDIISFDGGNVLPGGVASASARDGTLITLTGSGTFVLHGGHARKAHAATGGGTWETRSIAGSNAGSGRYSVTGLILFEPGPKPAPGRLAPVNDLVGNPDEVSAGLLVLRIAYFDEHGGHISDGILVVGCRLEAMFAPLFLPDEGFESDTAMMFEGVTATKGFDDFWRPIPPIHDFQRFIDANRTLFHIRHRDDHDRDDDESGR